MLPASNVTFLFTDIEGSTGLWERDAGTMSLALARHDALVRGAIEQHQGKVFKTVGDAFHAAFEDTRDAIAAARDVQIALAREAWPATTVIKVRIALHTGVADARADDYYGPTVNRVARLLAAGHGGQVLLSLATYESARYTLPAGVSLRDMGERRLKDLVRSERVYQATFRDLPTDFPPLKTLDARANNLPVQLTAFIGRDVEMRDIKDLVASSRLVTLAGVGGVGKTRLAFQVAADRVDEYADGVFAVELASLADPAFVPEAVASALGVTWPAGQPAVEALMLHCRSKEILLVLDNCEHVVEDVARLAHRILTSCARLRILASSREPLRVDGEAVYRVPSLAVPDPSVCDPGAMAECAAMQLFVDRARRVKATFRMQSAEAALVAAICRELDGIPLAIELAASRVRAMSVTEIQRRLAERFQFLVGGARTAVPRQQTLRALIDWSYRLLDEVEQTLLGRLSVFSGGFDLRGAVSVCAFDRIEGKAILDLVTSLVDKSLVVVEERAMQTRYRLLETLREYARDRLRDHGEERMLRDRHLDSYAELAEAGEAGLKGTEQPAWLETLELERDNLRAAIAWSGIDGTVSQGLRLASALRRFWDSRGYGDEGRRALAHLLESPRSGGIAPAVRMKALGALGALSLRQGDYPYAQRALEESLGLARALKDGPATASALHNLGNIAHFHDDRALARSLYEEALALSRELGNDDGAAHALNNLALELIEQDDQLGAESLLEECLALMRALGNLAGAAAALDNLGNLAYAPGDLSLARERHAEMGKIARELRNDALLATSLDRFARLAGDDDDFVAARALYEESLALRRRIGVRRGIAASLQNLGSVALDAGDLASSAAYSRESIAIWRDMGELHNLETTVAALAIAVCGQGDLQLAWQLLDESHSISRRIGTRRNANLIQAIASLACASGRPRWAALVFGALKQASGDREPNPRERRGLETYVAQVRAAAGAQIYESGWREGHTMTMDDAIARALVELSPGS